MAHQSDKIAYGDFQTPLLLARQICALLEAKGIAPATVIEPTCGEGAFVIAAVEYFPEIKHLHGLELNADHLVTLRTSLPPTSPGTTIVLKQGDFFHHDWKAHIASSPDPLLLLGNPPWVTNATLGKLNGTNLPEKSNLHGYRGFDALTGKSNFDISEWMLMHLLEWSAGHHATLALLCKTAVARKVIKHRWVHDLHPYAFSLYKIDAAEHFGASVDACLLVAECTREAQEPQCLVYDELDAPKASAQFGLRNKVLVADLEAFDENREMLGGSAYTWRSGVKHDGAKVMELSLDDYGQWQNGFGEEVEIEPTYVYPLLKSSDIANGVINPTRSVIITQKTPGEDTAGIETEAPDTWAYLQAHAYVLDKRRSSIYRGKPPFSIFGIGPYSFAPWKVAVSSLYKTLHFTIVGPVDGKPVMLDDTCYFLPCESENEAILLHQLVTSGQAKALLSSLIFWDEKRPVTIERLKKIDLQKVATRFGVETDYLQYAGENPYTAATGSQLQLPLGSGR